jgi:hypothetical protein
MMLVLASITWAERATVTAILTGCTHMYGGTTGAFASYRAGTNGPWTAGVISMQAATNTANTEAHFRRGNMVFPIKTANIPDNATVSACSVYYKVATAQSSQWWNVYLYAANARRPIPAATDHGIFNGWQSGTTTYNGTLLSNFGVNGKNAGTTYGAAIRTENLDSVRVSLHDTLWVAALLDHDVSCSMFTDATFPIFSIYGTENTPPVLAIQYTAPGSAVTQNRRYMQRNGSPVRVQSNGSPIMRRK